MNAANPPAADFNAGFHSEQAASSSIDWIRPAQAVCVPIRLERRTMHARATCDVQHLPIEAVRALFNHKNGQAVGRGFGGGTDENKCKILHFVCLLYASK
jgi:hypothetical protein